MRFLSLANQAQQIVCAHSHSLDLSLGALAFLDSGLPLLPLVVSLSVAGAQGHLELLAFQLQQLRSGLRRLQGFFRPVFLAARKQRRQRQWDMKTTVKILH